MAKGKNQNKKGKPTVSNTTFRTDIPNVLVLEGLSGGGAAIREAGGEVTKVSPTAAGAVATALESAERPVHAILLTGGGDVNPRLYNRRPHKRVYGVSETRDAVEMAVLAYARDRDIPVLGICRGMQIQNVEAGGTMRQHIDGHSGTGHEVHPVAGSLFSRAVADRKSVFVTSLHHQEVGKCAKSYRVTGRAPDHTVEAIESRDGRCLGVQFHPEMDTDYRYARDIFRWLVTEAARRAGMPTPPKGPRGGNRWGDYSGTSYYRHVKVTTAPRTTTVPTIGNPATGATTDRLLELLAADDRAPETPPTDRAAWYCAHDGIQFSDFTDYVDHQWLLHGEIVPGSGYDRGDDASGAWAMIGDD